MKFDAFIRTCRRDLVASASFSRILPRVCWLTINSCHLFYPSAALLFFASHNQNIVAFYLGSWFAFVKLYNSEFEQLPDGRSSVAPDITSDLDPEDRFFLNTICRRSGIKRADVRVLSSPGDATTSPHVKAAGSKYEVVLPGGFFDIWQAHPKAAEAMLAHEFGHILQGDVNLFVNFRRYIRFVAFKFAPFFFGVAVVGGILGTGSIMKAFSAVSDMRAASLIYGQNDYISRQFDQSDIHAELTVGVVSLSIWVLGAILVISAILALIFRILNYRSEAVCDRIAIALTMHEGIGQALGLFREDGGWRFFAPSLKWRSRKVAEVYQMLGSDIYVRRTPPSPIDISSFQPPHVSG